MKPTLTVMGRAAGCDIRLNAEGVGPIHCVLAHGPEGLILRDCQSETGTFVNGEKVTLVRLGDGDQIAVGPFSFQISLPRAVPGAIAFASEETLQRDKDALRIQAAAVVAQQAALTEEENRLQQQHLALKRQEEQLAAHLEEKRRHLLKLQEQVQQSRINLRKERAVAQNSGGEARRQAIRARDEAAQVLAKARTERNRLVELRRRLKKRWKKHWDAAEAEMARKQESIQAKERELEKEKARLQGEKAQLAEERMRGNGEMEVSRRQLREAWNDFRREQQQARENRNRELKDLAQQKRLLDDRDWALAEAERELAEERQQWEEARADLDQELEGLETRVRNYRLLIQEYEQHVGNQQTPAKREPAAAATPGLTSAAAVPAAMPDTPSQRSPQGETRSPDQAAPPAAPGVESDADRRQRLADLERLAEELADQRFHLVEQCVRLVRTRQLWQEEQEAVAASMEAMAVQLQERERALEAQAQSLAALESALENRNAELAQARQHLQVEQARLREQAKVLEAERDRVLAEVRSREALVKRNLEIIHELRERWASRRRREVEQVRRELDRWREQQKLLIAQREEYAQQVDALRHEQQSVAERALALEQYRLEYVARSKHSVAVERRLERLRRRWAALSTAAERKLEKDKQSLKAEFARLQEYQLQWQEHAREIEKQAAETACERARWEHEAAQMQIEQARMQQECEHFHAERRLHQRQIEELREEVERLGQALLDGGTAEETPTVKAA